MADKPKEGEKPEIGLQATKVLTAGFVSLMDTDFYDSPDAIMDYTRQPSADLEIEFVKYDGRHDEPIEILPTITSSVPEVPVRFLMAAD
ncbi:hypothetical protein DKP78_18965, partial [Enterococcus faecium]